MFRIYKNYLPVTYINIMEKIVQLLKKGYKFCLHELATDCVTFGPKEDFVGSL